jgi:hypothetical protein
MPRPSKIAEEAKKLAWAAAHPEASTITKAKQKQTKRFKPFSRTDTYAALGLLVGVLLVIIVPPLWLKAILLMGESIGVYLFLRYAHWSHGWSRFRRYGIASAVVVILLAVGIPQFISQWENEHPKQLTQMPLTPLQESHQSEPKIPAQNPSAPPHEGAPAAVRVEKGGKWHSTGDTVYAPNGTAIENKGEITSKYLRVNPPNSRTVPEELDVFIAASSDFRDSKGAAIWSYEVANFLRENFNEQVANKFLSQPSLAKKKEFLKQYRDSSHKQHLAL